MNSGGQCWNLAKKYIKEGHLGGKESLAYSASVTGERVGFFYREIASPVLGPMIKTMGMTVFLLMISLAHFD